MGDSCSVMFSRVLFVIDDSREMPAYGELMQGASDAIAQVQKALSSRSVFGLMLYRRMVRIHTHVEQVRSDKI